MLQWLRGKRVPAASAGPELSDALPAMEMVWRADASMPIPDWARQPWPEDGDPYALHRLANGQAAAWLDAMTLALPEQYTRTESDNFMLLSALEPRPRKVLLDYLERSRRRVLATLPQIAADAGYGKSVVMVLADEDTYYRYVSNYGSESSEPEAYSGGMFIDAGYGHFVFAQGTFESMERVVVHELTHCLVRHLPIPAWLNEGLAVNVEHRFVRQPPRYRAEELQFLLSRFWNASTIQEFWSGKSFLRPDDGQPLSYELARLLAQLLDKDYDVFARFCAEARQEDAGEAAAMSVLGVSLGELAAVVLGAGDWAPQPQSWIAGTEKGQF